MSTSNPEPFPLWLVPLFPLFFAGMWLGVCALLAYVSGWPSLAAHFKAAGRPEGELLKGQVAGVGWVGENRVTHMIPSESGLYLYVNPLFRFLRPPLLLPWPRVRFRRERKFLWVRSYEFDLAGITSVTLKRQGYEAIIKFTSGDAGGARRGL